MAASRMKTRFSGHRAANRYVERERKETGADDLYIDVYPEDGFVVYIPGPVQLEDQYKVLPEKILNADAPSLNRFVSDVIDWALKHRDSLFVENLDSFYSDGEVLGNVIDKQKV